jgi:hypothetical protein
MQPQNQNKAKQNKAAKKTQKGKRKILQYDVLSSAFCLSFSNAQKCNRKFQFSIPKSIFFFERTSKNFW